VSRHFEVTAARPRIAPTLLSQIIAEVQDTAPGVL
jgi:hypothetical protein